MATNTPNEPHIAPLTVTRNGIVYAAGVKIARYVPERQTLEFFDKNRMQSERRGGRSVEVRLADLAKLGERKQNV